MECPWCESEDIDVPTVDVDVGEQQVASATCGQCGASQMSFLAEMHTHVLPEEKRRGWFMGPDTENYVLLVENGNWLTPRAWFQRMAGPVPGDLSIYRPGALLHLKDLDEVIHHGVLMAGGPRAYVTSICARRLNVGLVMRGGPTTCLTCVIRS